MVVCLGITGVRHLRHPAPSALNICHVRYVLAAMHLDWIGSMTYGMETPEFPLHLGAVCDDLLRGVHPALQGILLYHRSVLTLGVSHLGGPPPMGCLL